MAKKTVNTPQSIKKDIDSLFNKKKSIQKDQKPTKKVSAVQKVEKQDKTPAIKINTKKLDKRTLAKMKEAKMNKIFEAIDNAKKTDGAQKIRRVTEDGYKIYTEEELGLNMTGGGDTELCPFDCDCCF